MRAKFKRDRVRFHRALNSDGVAVASLSAHCEAGREADARAFHAVMEHIRQVDAEQETILAIQVENEPGYAARTPVDYGPDGQRALRQRVPKAVLDFIEGEGEGSEYEAFVQNGCRRDGDWVETFGKRGYDLCTAYGVATWIDYVAMRGKQACTARRRTPDALWTLIWRIQKSRSNCRTAVFSLIST